MFPTAVEDAFFWNRVFRFQDKRNTHDSPKSLGTHGVLHWDDGWDTLGTGQASLSSPAQHLTPQPGRLSFVRALDLTYGLSHRHNSPHVPSSTTNLARPAFPSPSRTSPANQHLAGTSPHSVTCVPPPSPHSDSTPT
ncbi:hypothetical protein CORC01_09342 [Colletotrichum orchidophilum]|uniref:Uncharacterized protein n=1 Tax=Colletotrichum orchidophilum TaxID=1209926 RepID=A0A1G4B1R6_9PEZI|nr:uncharacterized protein CORC01_09342 [Colletotrichum orchidophilum]OHE95331.1 hypothetical protein CORC01_09342 [Colletotrichum orchidophilum]